MKHEFFGIIYETNIKCSSLQWSVKDIVVRYKAVGLYVLTHVCDQSDASSKAIRKLITEIVAQVVKYRKTWGN